MDFGYKHLSVRTRWLSIRLPLSGIVVAVALLAVAVLVLAMAMTLGDYSLSLGEVWAALLGGGEAAHRRVVWEWRLPVALAALVFGALLGIGGAIFQSLTRNPLGSPDIIGFDSGSYTAVVIAVLLFGSGDYWSLAGASLTGGLITALAVYLLAYRGGVGAFRLIVVGVGMSALLGAINAHLITRADVNAAMVVGFWGAGSISRVSWAAMLPSLLLAAIIALAAFSLTPALRSLELGDDTAATHGTAVGRARLALVVVGVATTALATAAAGPIGFIALAAPQLARRLIRNSEVGLLPAAAMGAALLACAHVVSLLLAEFYRPVPVGLITVCLGGSYLIWLLTHEARVRSRSV